MRPCHNAAIHYQPENDVSTGIDVRQFVEMVTEERIEVLGTPPSQYLY